MTIKKTDAAAPVARFVFGAVETAAADKWRKADISAEKAARDFYDAVIVAHGVDLAWLAPVKAGEARSPEAKAAFDFVRRGFAVYKVGAACADQVFDRNVAGTTMLHPAGRKAQTKRALTQSVLGAKEWGVFLSRLKAFAGDADEAKRGANARATDMKFVVDRITAIVNRLRRDPEKFDGSIDLDTAAKLAKYLADGEKMFGLRLK